MVDGLDYFKQCFESKEVGHSLRGILEASRRKDRMGLVALEQLNMMG